MIGKPIRFPLPKEIKLDYVFKLSDETVREIKEIEDNAKTALARGRDIIIG